MRLSGMLEPGLTRKAINLLAHYDVSDAFSPFIEAKFVRVTTAHLQAGRLRSSQAGRYRSRFCNGLGVCQQGESCS